MKVLNRIGFRWVENGAVLRVVVDGQAQDVFVPLHRLALEFGEAMAQVGCPLPPSVGFEPYSVAGLFSRIKRAVKKTTRVVTAPHRAIIKRVVPRAIRRRAMKLRRQAVSHVRHRVLPLARQMKGYMQSPYARYAALAMSAFPATAPAGASLLAAQTTMAAIDRGQKAARLVQQGIRRPGDVAAIAEAMQQRESVNNLGQLARAGHPQAMQFFGALQQYAR